MPWLFVVVLAVSSSSVIPERDPDGRPHLRSESVVVRVADTDAVVLEKNPRVVRPIASVTKLLSGLVLSQLEVDPKQAVTIGEDDKDRRKWSRSRLFVGLTAPWGELIQAALGASDNRAMYASVRTAMPASEFVERMNRRAAELGMTSSHFVDPAGVDPGNVSTARDLLGLLAGAAEDQRVREWALTPRIDLATARGTVSLHNPDRLVYSGSWDVIVGKTGYTVEAGRTLVLRVRIQGHPVDMVFLGSREMASVFGDAGRVKRWLEPRLAQVAAAGDAPAASAPAASGLPPSTPAAGSPFAEPIAGATTTGAPVASAPAAGTPIASAPAAGAAPGADTAQERGTVAAGGVAQGALR